MFLYHSNNLADAILFPAQTYMLPHPEKTKGMNCNEESEERWND